MSLSGVQTLNLEKTVSEIENRIIVRAIEKARGSLSRAAEILEIPRSSLRNGASRPNNESPSPYLQIPSSPANLR